METRHARAAEHRRFHTSQTSLSRLLASLRGFADLHWSRVFDLRRLFVSAHSCVAFPGFGCDVVQGKSSSRIRTVPSWSPCWDRRLSRQVVWEFSPAMYGAVGLLVIASLWNTWPRREKPKEARTCSHCNTEKIERSI